MGVAGLWDVLRPASKIRSLTDLAVTDGFEKNPHGVRGYRIGIDASIWSFHMEYGREGENPELRTLFFRCATLMRCPFLPLFVFDGPKRPDFKRGKRVSKAPHKLIPSMKQIIEAFGFEHRTAPGEAEAELAYLNQLGIIDGILSDDVDNFLFGAITVIRNPSNNLSGNKSKPVLNANGKDDKNHTLVFKSSEIKAHPDIGLTKGGFILIGLLSGGDYHTGLEKCGMKTAVALARCGFGDSLYQAAISIPRDQLPAFLDTWRSELRHEIRTNSRGFIGRKSPALANCVTNAFPDIDVMMSYVSPVTSETMGRPYRPGDIRWDKEPDISKIAGICEFFFEWGYREAIIKRFRTVIWHSAVLRILRRAVLDSDERNRTKSSSNSHQPFSTPSRKGRRLDAAICGTPSKMIAKHFSSLGIADSDDEDDDEKSLIVKIHSSRNHVYTDNLLEYRLEIAPAQLVHLAEMGIKGTRVKPMQEWEDEPEQQDKDQESKDPFEHMRVWMPACMVKIVEPRLVEEFDEVEAKKAAKKANKGQGRGRKKKAVDGDADEPAASPAKPKKAPAPSRRAPSPVESDDEVDLLPSAPPKGKARAIPTAAASKSKAASSSTSTNAKARSKLRLTAPGLSSDNDSDDDMLPTPSQLFAPRPQHPVKSSILPTRSDVFDAFGSDNELGPSPSPTRRTGVKDLFKKNQPSSISLSVASTSVVTGYFPASKPSARNTSQKTQKAQISASSSIIVTKKTTTSTKNANAGPSSARNPASTVALRFFDDYDSPTEGGVDESFKSDDLFTSRTPSPRKRGLSKSSSHDSLELNDDSFSDPPPLFPPRPAVTKAKAGSSAATSSSTFTSPSKSRAHSTLSISDSDSDSRDRYRKSPRKSASHQSPAASRALSRATSPTPQSRSTVRSSVPVPSGSKKPLSKVGLNLGQIRAKVDLKTLPVYELSDEDDDDEVVAKPTSPTKRTTEVKAASSNASKSRADIPPLARAREKSAWKDVPVRETIVIDLT